MSTYSKGDLPSEKTEEVVEGLGFLRDWINNQFQAILNFADAISSRSVMPDAFLSREDFAKREFTLTGGQIINFDFSSLIDIKKYWAEVTSQLAQLEKFLSGEKGQEISEFMKNFEGYVLAEYQKFLEEEIFVPGTRYHEMGEKFWSFYNRVIEPETDLMKERNREIGKELGHPVADHNAERR